MKPIPAILAAPWAIEPGALRVIFGVWSRGKLDASALAQAKAEWEARKAAPQRARAEEPTPVEGTGGTLRIVGDVGVISVEGPLFRHANLFSDFSGGTTYDALWRALEAAMEHPLISKVMLRVNSPGGEADGVNELGKFIRRCRERKPLYAYADGMCASAAYWLASQAERIYAEEAAEVGSIGVRCGIVDDSAAMEAAGVREIEVISSQSPNKRSKPVDESVVARLQTRIDDLADLFVNAVADGRGVSAETVLEDFGQGGVMIASKALAAGLVDEVADFNGALAAMAGASSSQRRAARAMGGHMAVSKERPTAGEGPEWQCAGCNEMMGPSAKAYCAKCSEDDDDGDEPDGDEDEDAKALGLEIGAKADVRRTRAASLVAFEREVFAAVGAASHADALAAVKAGADAVGKVATLAAEAAKAKAEEQKAHLRGLLERGLMGSPGKGASLSLGAIQKKIPAVLRGESKRAYVAAMEQLAVTADAEKRGLTAADVIGAACSVPLSGEDIDAIGEYVANAEPVAAPAFVEPVRDPEKESDEMNAVYARIDAAAEKARAALDRNHKPAAK